MDLAASHGIFCFHAKRININHTKRFQTQLFNHRHENAQRSTNECLCLKFLSCFITCPTCSGHQGTLYIERPGINFLGWGESESIRTSSTLWPIVPAPDNKLWVWNSWWNENCKEKTKYSKTTRRATLWTTNTTWPDLGSNPGGRLNRRLSCVTASEPSFHLNHNLHANQFLSKDTAPGPVSAQYAETDLDWQKPCRIYSEYVNMYRLIIHTRKL